MRTDHSALWRVIYIARGERQAMQVEDALVQAGFMVDRRRQIDGDAKIEDIEIRALDAEAEEARLFLLEQGF